MMESKNSSEKQLRLVELTLRLELKTKEYNQLCKEYEETKQRISDPNDRQYAFLLVQFEKNSKEIEEINNEMKRLKDSVND